MTDDAFSPFSLGCAAGDGAVRLRRRRRSCSVPNLFSRW